MSDFGAIITVNKKDELFFSETEISKISTELIKTINTGEYENALGDKFYQEFDIEQDEDNALVYLLSEHYFSEDEEENADNLEFVTDTELPQIEEITKTLENIFPDYDFEGNIEEF